jgi:hypothetical protein
MNAYDCFRAGYLAAAAMNIQRPQIDEQEISAAWAAWQESVDSEYWKAHISPYQPGKSLNG